MSELDLHRGNGPAPIVIEEAPSQLFMQLKGVAASRGRYQKPANLEAARIAVRDLATTDPDVQEQLAAEALLWSPRRPA